MNEIDQLEQAIVALEGQRSVLGDAVVDAAQASMREKLSALRAAVHASAPQQDQPPNAPPQLKYVTVLFADVTGSTQLAQNLDPEDDMAIMDGALQRFNAVIEQQGGRVLRFMGDGLKAIFGLPLAREDDAERAVQAGLALLNDAQIYARQVQAGWGLDGFNIRVGINTGQVILGGGMEADNSAIGMAINLAARMESTAPPGSLRISHDTYRHIRGVFDVQPQPPLLVKGKDEPLQTYLVLGTKPRAFRTTTRGVEGVETRMIGREAELSQLQGAFQRAVLASETQVVTAVGEAGVGKSRLLYEFENWLELRPERVRYFKGRATLQKEVIPYNLLHDLFAYRFAILESDPANIARQKIEAGMADFFDQESQMKAHFVGALAGYNFSGSSHLAAVKDDPQQLRTRALFYLAQFFTAVAENNPTVIFLEDIHWADAPSLNAIQHLVREAPRLHLLVVCLARPVFFERYPSWGEVADSGGAREIRIRLNPLSPERCQQLVIEILKKVEAVPDSLRDLIVTRAEGNPFYVEELIKVLIDDGVILKDRLGHVWRIDPERLQDLRVPPTLTAVLQARLDSLPSAEKSILQQAAVVGRIFWDAVLPVLQSALQPPTPTLASLSQRELIYPQKTSAFAGASEYIFKHALLRDVTYESVLKRTRRVYHKQVAEWLVSATQASGRTEEYSPLIAEHFMLAGETGPAADWYLRAGQRARTQGAPSEARKFFEHAMQLLLPTDRERRWSALLGLSQVLSVLAERQSQRENLAELMALAQELGDDQRLAQAYYHQSFFFALQGDDRKALDVYELGLAQSRKVGDRKLETLFLALKVISMSHLGDLVAAGAVAEEALAIAQETGDEQVQARAFANVAVYYTELGDIARAAQLLSQASTISHRLGDRFGESISLGNLGYDFVLLGLPNHGPTVLERAIQLGAEIGARREVAYYRLNLGLACWRAGELSRARQLLEETTPELEAVSDRFGRGCGLEYLALVLEQSGDINGAMWNFSEAREVLSAIGAIGYAADALAGLARCALAIGDIQEARQHAQQLWSHLNKQGSKGMEFAIRAYLTCAQIFSHSGETDLALQALEAGYHELMQRAGKISDLEWRKSFLENIPEHRAVTQMWQQVATE